VQAANQHCRTGCAPVTVDMPTHPCCLHRGLSQLRPQPAEVELTSDPDNNPPRSRLFIVVPKTADAAMIQARAYANGPCSSHALRLPPHPIIPFFYR
jgi:hypothetical protein